MICQFKVIARFQDKLYRKAQAQISPPPNG